jgi:excisionase family DNA binding protein
MPRTKAKPAQTALKAKKAMAGTAPMTAPLEVLTLAEAAAYLRLPEADVLRLARDQGLPGRKVGDEWRFLKAAIQDWLRVAFLSKQAFWETHFGALQDDPYLEDMLQKIYQRRGRPESEED